MREVCEYCGIYKGDIIIQNEPVCIRCLIKEFDIQEIEETEEQYNQSIFS